MNWSRRPPEEQNLFNPSFCSILLWNAAREYSRERHGTTGLPFELCFLVLPAVLRQSTRCALPRTVATSIPVWLDQYPLMRSQIARGARQLKSFTREALLFGAQHDLLSLQSTTVVPNGKLARTIKKTINTCTEEVQDCAKKAEFFGRWIAQSSSPETSMALFGVKL